MDKMDWDELFKIKRKNMKIEIIPNKIKKKKRNLNWVLISVIFCFILLIGLGYFILPGVFLHDDLQYQTYIQNLRLKANTSEPIFFENNEMNLTISPEVAVIFYTSNGLSKARQNILLCNKLLQTIEDINFAFRFNEELTHKKLYENVIEYGIVSYNVYIDGGVIGQYPNGSDILNGTLVYEPIYGYYNARYDRTPFFEVTIYQGQRIYYITGVNFEANSCRDFDFEYIPSNDDNTMKWDAYLWLGTLQDPTYSLLLDPNWILESSAFQIETFAGAMQDDGQNLSLDTSAYSGYAESVRFCPDGNKQNWSLADWNVPYFDYGIAQYDTSDMHYYLQLNETGTEPLLENITNIGWVHITDAIHNTTDCIFGNCVTGTSQDDGWRRTTADDDGLEATNLSVEAWVKSSVTSTGEDAAIWGYQSSDDEAGVQFHAKVGTGGFSVYVYGDATTLVNEDSGVNILDMEWHHVYGVIGTNGVKMYVDGNLVHTHATEKDVATSFTYEYNTIGNYKSSLVRGWVGNLDEVVIRTGADAYLTASEVMERFKEGVGKYDIAVKFFDENASASAMPYTNISVLGATQKRELNESIECIQYRYYGYKINLSVQDPYLISINFTYTSLGAPPEAGGFNLTADNLRIYTDTGTNLSSEDLKLSFTPLTNDTSGNLYANVSFLIDLDSLPILGEDLVFGMHMSNASDYIGNLVATETGGVIAGDVGGYLGMGTKFNGSQRLDLGDDDALDEYTEATWSFWSKQARGGYEPNAGLLSKHIGGSPGLESWRLRTEYSDEIGVALRCDSPDIAETIRSTNHCGFSVDVLMSNKWLSIIVVYNGTTITYYQNGIYCDENTTFNVPCIQNTNAPLYIGYDFLGGYFNGTIDEVHIWERALNSTEVSTLYELSPNRFKNVELTNGTESTITLESENTTKAEVWKGELYISDAEQSAGFTSNDLLVLNAPPTTPTLNYPIDNLVTGNQTVGMSCSGSTDPEGDTIIYEFWGDKSNPPTTIYQNLTLTTTTFNFSLGDGDYYWRCRANDNQSVSSYTATRTIDVRWLDIVYRDNYAESSPLEGASAYFENNISINPHKVFNVTSIILTYNNSNYTTTLTKINATYYKSDTNINILLSTANPETKTYNYWYNYNLINLTSMLNKSVDYTQSVYQLLLFNCSVGNATSVMVFNYSFMEEKVLGGDARLNTSSFDATFIFWHQVRGINKSLSFDLTNKTEIGICLTPKDKTFYTGGHIDYIQAGFDRRYYYYQNYYVTNTTHHRSLYLLEITSATGIEFTIVDTSEEPIINALVYLDKYYAGANEYRTVAMGKTNELGKTFIYLDTGSTIYRIKVMKNNELLHTTLDFIVPDGTTEYPLIRVGEPVASTYVSECFEAVISSLSFDNDTKTITASFSNPYSLNYILDVYERRPENDTWLCSNQYSGAIGNLNCYYGNRTGGRFIATLSGECVRETDEGTKTYKMILNQLEIDLRSNLLLRELGSDALWISALMILTLFFIGLWKPEVSIIFGILGLIITTLLGFLVISVGVLIAIIIAAILLIVRSNR